MNHNDMTSMSLIEYRVRVERAAGQRAGEAIYNGTTDHAQIVIETLFRAATNKMCVLSEALNDGVYGHDETIEAAERFLSDETHPLRVLVEREPAGGWAGNKFYKRFSGSKNVDIRELDLSRAPGFDFHFTTADDDSFRFEPDKSEHSAVAAFGNRKAAENLNNIFEDLWKYGKPVNKVVHQLQS